MRWWRRRPARGVDAPDPDLDAEPVAGRTDELAGLDPAPGDQLTQLLVMREWLRRNADAIEHLARAEDIASQRAAYYAATVSTLREVAARIDGRAFDPSADGYLPAYISPLGTPNRRPWTG